MVALKRRRLYISILVIALFAIAILFDRYFNQSNNINNYSTKLAYYLWDQESDIEDQIKNTGFFYRRSQPVLRNSETTMLDDERTLKNLSAKPYGLMLYQGDQLLFWTNNEVELPGSIRDSLLNSGQPQFRKLENGYYLLQHFGMENLPDSVYLYAVIPIKKDYLLESQYLENVFAEQKDFPVNIVISDQETPYAVKTREGSTLFYLDAIGKVKDPNHQRLLLVLYLIAFITLSVFINDVANYLVVRYHPWVGASFLLLTIFGLRYWSIQENFPGHFSELKVFSKAFNIPVLGGSLGDLLVNGVLLLWMMVFFHREFEVKPLAKLPKFWRFVLSSINYFLVMLGLIITTRVFKSLVIESGITFDFDNVFNLDIYSIMAILGVTLLIISLFLFSHRMMLGMIRVGMPRYSRLGSLAVSLLFVIPVIWYIDIGLPLPHFLLFLFTYMVLFDLFIESRIPGLTWIVIWLVLFAAYSSTLLFKYNLDKDAQTREEYARALTEGRDEAAESEIDFVYRQILEDDSLKTVFASKRFPKVTEETIRNWIDPFYIINNYLFNNYAYDLFVLRKSDRRILAGAPDQDHIQHLLDDPRGSDTTDLEQLTYFYDKNGQFYYVLKFPTQKRQNLLSGLIFKRRRRDASKVYTELLLESDFKRLNNLDKYDFSVYRNNLLVAQAGKPFEVAKIYEQLPPPGVAMHITTSSRADLIYHGPDNTIVVIGKSLGGYPKPISLFSYLFVLLILVVILLGFINSLINAVPAKIDFPMIGRPTLRNRIQLSVIFLILGSFLIIGIVTVAFFRSSSIEYHENRLIRKISAVLSDVEHEISLITSPDAKTLDFQSVVDPISNIHKMDINIYNLDGHLIGTSEDYIFNKGVIAPRMVQSAYLALKQKNQSLVILEEKIGNLAYKSAFVPLHNEDRDIIAYLGLPYYSKDRNLRRDIFDFMGTLLNVYVFLLLIAGVIAIAVANSITQPITKIGEKLRRFKLGGNEPLEWNNQDELGDLISEYNQMIRKLEESTEKLKLSEREGAWREMAKQVAHEIKNPLTPMKLSIQYLMMAYRSNPKEIEPILNRVSKTLIEQIDGLSKIASEFSNFAKMPKAENTNFNLNELVHSVYELFQKNLDTDLEMELQLPPQQFEVFGDKSHLMRVLNNLIKNSIQAIPDDRKGKIKVSIFPKNDNIIIQVSDNGIGISEEMKDKVFFPNFTTKTSGMGLGLAISKSIIDAIEGDIYFKTQVNKGTDFYVELPIRKVRQLEVVR